jgi:hypothetical protein
MNRVAVELKRSYEENKDIGMRDMMLTAIKDAVTVKKMYKTVGNTSLTMSHNQLTIKGVIKEVGIGVEIQEMPTERVLHRLIAPVRGEGKRPFTVTFTLPDLQDVTVLRIFVDELECLDMYGVAGTLFGADIDWNEGF